MSHWVVSEVDSSTLSVEQILKETLEILFLNILESADTSLLSVELVSMINDFLRVVAVFFLI